LLRSKRSVGKRIIGGGRRIVGDGRGLIRGLKLLRMS